MSPNIGLVFIVLGLTYLFGNITYTIIQDKRKKDLQYFINQYRVVKTTTRENTQRYNIEKYIGMHFMEWVVTNTAIEAEEHAHEMLLDAANKDWLVYLKEVVKTEIVWDSNIQKKKNRKYRSILESIPKRVY